MWQARSHTGWGRRQQEDAVAVWPQWSMTAVADGLGGHAGGAWASRWLIEQWPLRLQGWWPEAPQSTAEPTIDTWWHERRVLDITRALSADLAAQGQASAHFKGLGACWAVAWLWGPHLWVGHVGDVRAFLWPAHGAPGLQPLTQDHAEVDSLGVRRVSRALGHLRDDGPGLELHRHRLAPGDRVLVCSDGLQAALGLDDIAGVLAPGQALPATADALLAASLRTAAPDNLSFALAEVAPG